MTSPADATRLRFDEFDLDIGNARLSRSGEPVDLPPKAFELLVCLATRAQTLVLKDELLDIVWGRRFVSEGAVKTVVSELRAALGDNARAPRWIETVQRRGYRFIGAVVALGEDAPSPASAASAATAASLPATPVQGNLPAAGAGLVGRDEDIRTLVRRLDQAPLLTLTGPGGVGKSSLALAVAQLCQPRHADGVWRLELAPLSPGAPHDALRNALARTLRIAPLGTGSETELVRALRGQRLLLLLDNAEHLLDTLVPWIAAWAPQLPELRLLVTSREPLQIPGEQIWRVDPLPVPAAHDEGPEAGHDDAPAMRLLVERIAGRLNGFMPSPGQRPALAQICRSLDGLPLALELAAARVPVLGVHGLADHLGGLDGGRRLKLLTQGARTAAPHQRTLRATLDWSHALLNPTERRVFRRLAVFCGGFSAAMAQGVCDAPGDDPWALLDTLAALADKSMLVGADPNDPQARLGLLESLREYATEQLELAGETAAAARRHLVAVAAYWAAADADSLDEPVLPWTRRHEVELDNLRAALRWAQAHAEQDPEVVELWLDLVASSARFWQRIGLAAEGARACLAAQAQAEACADLRRRAGVDLAIASLSRFAPMLTPERHLALARRAAQTFAELGDPLREYLACYLAWDLALEIGEQVERDAFFKRMDALVQPDWGPLRRRFVRAAWAQDQRLLGHADVFLQCCRDELTSMRAIGAQAESWAAGHMLMLAEHDQGRPDRALAVGEATLADVRASGHLRSQSQLLCMYAAMRADAGDPARTREVLDLALPTLETMARAELLYLALAWLAAHEGRSEDAARLLGWFESPQREAGVYGPRTFTRRSVARLRAQLCDELGEPGLQALMAGAAALGEADARRVGLRHADGDRRQQARDGPAGRTDENPTAS